MPDRILPRSLLPLFLLLVAATTYSQSPLTGGLNVSGVGLGAKQQDVIRKLGKPTRTVTSKKIDECIGSYIRTLDYPGLKLELDDASGGYTVFSMEITSENWDISGAKIGDATADVQKRFGTRGRRIEKQAGNPFWFYDMPEDNPGGTSFYFRGGKLVKAVSSFMMC